MKDTEKNLSILKSLKLLLTNHFGTNIQDVILFGSQIKGTSTKFSDYDILIILKNDYDWKFQEKITDVVYDMELDYDILFDKHLVSLNEMKNSLKGAEPIYKNAIKYGLYA